MGLFVFLPALSQVVEHLREKKWSKYKRVPFFKVLYELMIIFTNKSRYCIMQKKFQSFPSKIKATLSSPSSLWQKMCKQRETKRLINIVWSSVGRIKKPQAAYGPWAVACLCLYSLSYLCAVKTLQGLSRMTLLHFHWLVCLCNTLSCFWLACHDSALCGGSSPAD